MANSYAFVLSKNTYPDAWQANFLGVDQGTMIVYANTDTLSSSTVLFADSRLTQPIYGNPDLWLGAQLLTNDSVKYAVTISDTSAVNPVSNPTTSTTSTTAAPTTTTTSGAPSTTTTTSAQTTTTTSNVATWNMTYYEYGNSMACNDSMGTNVTVYTSGSNLVYGKLFWLNSSLTTPFEIPYTYYARITGVSNIVVLDSDNGQAAYAMNVTCQNTYYLSTTSNSTSNASCGEQFTNGSTVVYCQSPTINSLYYAALYTDSGYNTPFVGNGNWYYISTTNVNGGVGYPIQVASNGLISNQGIAC